MLLVDYEQSMQIYCLIFLNNFFPSFQSPPAKFPHFGDLSRYSVRRGRCSPHGHPLRSFLRQETLFFQEESNHTPLPPPRRGGIATTAAICRRGTPAAVGDQKIKLRPTHPHAAKKVAVRRHRRLGGAIPGGLSATAGGFTKKSYVTARPLLPAGNYPRRGFLFLIFLRR